MFKWLGEITHLIFMYKKKRKNLKRRAHVPLLLPLFTTPNDSAAHSLPLGIISLSWLFPSSPRQAKKPSPPRTHQSSDESTRTRSPAAPPCPAPAPGENGRNPSSSSLDAAALEHWLKTPKPYIYSLDWEALPFFPFQENLPFFLVRGD
jgi:hypothetical protein